MAPTRGTDFDHIANQPAWTGVKFVETRHHDVPAALDPASQTLPSPFVVVITGASRGIGRAMAKAFAAAGASGLLLTARNESSLEQTKAECKSLAKNNSTLKITTLSADNAVESSALAVADALRKNHDGHLHLLVNNAGILTVDKTAFGNNLIDMNVANIEDTMRTNYFGRFYMIKHLLPLILATPGPHKNIVNISSIGSHLSGPLGYSLSALATNRLSQRVAEAYGDQGVFCCAVHPGAVMPEIMPDGAPEAFKNFSTDDPGLCGAVLIWLVKEKREWLNGRYVDATWDVEELEKKKDEIVQGDKLKMRLLV